MLVVYYDLMRVMSDLLDQNRLTAIPVTFHSLDIHSFIHSFIHIRVYLFIYYARRQQT